MKRKNRKKVVTPHTYYRLFICGKCDKKTENAPVIWEQYVSDNCVIMQINCPKCGRKEVPLINKEQYKKNIINGDYFKTTP